MATDFRANQVRLDKLIASGSTIIVYPSGAASDLAGTINTSVFPQTGFGSDVFMFVSGGNTIGTSVRGVTLFGGQVVASGSIYSIAGFSGSLTKLKDGTSYLVASGAVTITSNSNGSVTIFAPSAGSSFAFASTSVAYSGSSGLTGTSKFTFNDNTNQIRLLTASLLIEENIASPDDAVLITSNKIKKVDSTTETSETSLYIHASNGIISGSGGGIEIRSGDAGFNDSLIQANGGPVYLLGGSGSVVESTAPFAGTGGGITLTSGKGGNSLGTSSGGAGGDLTLQADTGGTSVGGSGGNGGAVYLYAGAAASGALGGGNGGSVSIKSGDADFAAGSGDSGYISIDIGYRANPDLSTAASIRIDPSRFARNVLVGFPASSTGSLSDGYFIVSGSVLSKSVFLGDLVSSRSIKAELGFSGSLTKLIDGSSYLIAGSNITITSASNGAVTIAGTGGSSFAFNSTSVAYSGSSGLTGNSGFTFDDNTKSLILSGNFTIQNGIISASVIDSRTASGSSVLTLTHNAGASAAGIASDITLRTTNAAGTETDAIALSGQLSTATNGAEVSRLDVKTRTAGAATRTTFRVYGSGGIGVGSATNLSDPGDGGIVIPTTQGVYINSGGTNYTALGVFGGSTIILGSGAFNVSIAAFGLSISAGQGTSITNGALLIAGAAGFRRLNVNVNDADKTVSSTENMINMINVTTTRTVTLPAAASGTLVRVVNMDGSANNSKYIVVTGSSNAKIDGINTTGHFGIIQPYGWTEYLNDGTHWQVVGTKQKNTNESHIDFAMAYSQAIPTENGGDYTVGIQFMPATASICTGFRLFWSGSAPKDFMVKLWSGSAAIASQSIGLTGSNLYVGTWTSPITMSRYHKHFITFREITGTNYYVSSVPDMQDFFGGNGYTAVRIGNNNNIIVRSFYAYNSGTGDSIPNTYGIGNNMIMIEPIMFC